MLNLPVHSSRRVRWASVTLAIVFVLAFVNTPHPTLALSSSTMGIIVPLYSYPGGTWTSVIQAKTANPGVSVVAVINPDNGPGTSKDQNYVSGIQALRSAGVVVLGYVHTSYAARPAASVVADINSYNGWYNVSGIFLDEMSNVAGNEGYYSTLNHYIKSLGYTMTVGNPGADTIPSYIGTVDVIVVYENLGLPSPSTLAGWHASYAKSNFAAISYGVDSVNQTFIAQVSDSVGYIYLTPGSLPNPYGSLPSYFGTMVAMFGVQSSVNIQSQTTSTSSSTTSTATRASGESTMTSSSTASTTTSTLVAITATSSSTTPGLRGFLSDFPGGLIIGLRDWISFSS